MAESKLSQKIQVAGVLAAISLLLFSVYGLFGSINLMNDENNCSHRDLVVLTFVSITSILTLMSLVHGIVMNKSQNMLPWLMFYGLCLISFPIYLEMKLDSILLFLLGVFGIPWFFMWCVYFVVAASKTPQHSQKYEFEMSLPA